MPPPPGNKVSQSMSELALDPKQDPNLCGVPGMANAVSLDGLDAANNKNRGILSSTLRKIKDMRKDPLVISYPSNFKHELHVGYNAETREFTGLPPQWKEMLLSANISNEDQEKNAEAIVAVVNFMQENNFMGEDSHNQSKYMQEDQPTPPAVHKAPPPLACRCLYRRQCKRMPRPPHAFHHGQRHPG